MSNSPPHRIPQGELREAAEEAGHDMPADGVTVEHIAGSRAHGGALLDVPGMPEKVLAWIADRT
jgi:hypothetical protein